MKDIIEKLWILWQNLAEAGEIKIDANFIKEYDLLNEKINSLTTPQESGVEKLNQMDDEYFSFKFLRERIKRERLFDVPIDSHRNIAKIMQDYADLWKELHDIVQHNNSCPDPDKQSVEFSREDMIDLIVFMDREVRENAKGVRIFTTGQIATNTEIVKQFQQSQAKNKV